MNVRKHSGTFCDHAVENHFKDKRSCISSRRSHQNYCFWRIQAFLIRLFTAGKFHNSDLLIHWCSWWTWTAWNYSLTRRLWLDMWKSSFVMEQVVHCLVINRRLRYTKYYVTAKRMIVRRSVLRLHIEAFSWRLSDSHMNYSRTDTASRIEGG